MKSLLPTTPTLRFERMLLAGLAALLCAVVGLAFLALALQAARQADWALLPGAGSAALRAWTLGSLGGSVLMMALAFLCFAVIKLEPAWKAAHLRLFVGTRLLGMALVWIAVAVGLSGAVVHALAG